MHTIYQHVHGVEAVSVGAKVHHTLSTGETFECLDITVTTADGRAVVLTLYGHSNAAAPIKVDVA